MKKQTMKIDNENKRHDDGIVALLHAKAQFRRHSIPPINIDWEQLDTLARERFPLLTTALQKCETLSRQEQRTCILLRFGFKNKEIAILLNTSIQRVANAKASANQKLFGKRSALPLAKNLHTLDGQTQ